MLALLLLVGCENAPFKKEEPQSAATVTTETSPVILDSLTIQNNSRIAQVTAIQAIFAKRTSHERARQLAGLCFSKTLNTPFMPFDLAEIALAETGGNRLSGLAVSPRGARGVWQLMPYRAKSHGYSPDEMKDDKKCADAAVRELAQKLAMADGNLERAKKYYCGQGPHANAYIKKVRQYHQELVAEQGRQDDRLAMVESGIRIR